MIFEIIICFPSTLYQTFPVVCSVSACFTCSLKPTADFFLLGLSFKWPFKFHSIKLSYKNAWNQPHGPVCHFLKAIKFITQVLRLDVTFFTPDLLKKNSNRPIQAFVTLSMKPLLSYCSSSLILSACIVLYCIFILNMLV